MKFFKTCVTCNGTGEVYIDRSFHIENGLLKKYCKECNGKGIQDCTSYVKELEERSQDKNQLAVSVQCFIDELKYFGLSD